jgi:hypothetical protein
VRRRRRRRRRRRFFSQLLSVAFLTDLRLTTL